MHTRGRLALVALAATATLSLVTSSANAGRLSLSSTTFRAVWFNTEIRIPVGTVTCPITLEGSFHARTIAKTFNSLIGYVTRAPIPTRACTNGNAVPLPETFPWHVRYSGFSGTLPNITSLAIRIVGMGMRIESMLPCLINSEAAEPVVVDLAVTAEHRIVNAQWNGSFGIRTTLCFPAQTTFRGNGEMTVLNSTSRITVTLI